MLYEDRIDFVPFWLPQMDIDIRKPAAHDSFDASETEPIQPCYLITLP